MQGRIQEFTLRGRPFIPLSLLSFPSPSSPPLLPLSLPSPLEVGPLKPVRRSEGQGRSQEFDLGGYKSMIHTGHWHDIEFVLGQGDKTTT